jgi:hypothetical protein
MGIDMVDMKNKSEGTLDHETRTGLLVGLFEGKIIFVYAYINGVLHYWRSGRGLVIPKNDKL